MSNTLYNHRSAKTFHALWQVASAACLVLLLLGQFPQTAVGQEGLVQAALDEEDSEEGEFVQLVKQLNVQYLELFKSGTGSGTIEVMFSKAHEPAQKILDCKFKIAFDGAKMRLEREYVTNDLTEKHQPESWEIDANGCVHSIMIVAGGNNDSYWARFDEHGQANCLIFTGYLHHQALENYDAPRNPHHHFNEVFDELEGIAEDLVTTSLQNGGLIARMIEPNGLSIELFFLPPQPLRLCRVAVRSGEEQMEFNYRWEEGDTGAYVKEFGIHRREPGVGDLRVNVTYDAFQPNVAVSPELFKLKSLNVPVGTSFTRNLPELERYEFDGEQLVKKAK